MLYSDLGFWLAQQPAEVQIITIYLMGLITMVLFVLDCWYEDWTAKEQRKEELKNLKNYLTVKTIT